MKIVMTADDGTVSEFFDQAFVNAAVDQAIANHAATHGTVTSDTVTFADGTTETMEPAEAADVEATEDAAPAA